MKRDFFFCCLNIYKNNEMTEICNYFVKKQSVNCKLYLYTYIVKTIIMILINKKKVTSKIPQLTLTVL